MAAVLLPLRYLQVAATWGHQRGRDMLPDIAFTIGPAAVLQGAAFLLWWSAGRARARMQRRTEQLTADSHPVRHSASRRSRATPPASDKGVTIVQRIGIFDRILGWMAMPFFIGDILLILVLYAWVIQVLIRPTAPFDPTSTGWALGVLPVFLSGIWLFGTFASDTWIPSLHFELDQFGITQRRRLGRSVTIRWEEARLLEAVTYFRPEGRSIERRGVELVGIGAVIITLGPSMVVYHLGTNAAFVSFFGGIVVASVGVMYLAMAVRRIQFAGLALAAPPSSPPTPVQGERRTASPGPKLPSTPARPPSGVSRRTVLTTGAVVAGLAGAGGVTWAILSRKPSVFLRKPATKVPRSRSSHTPAPSPSPGATRRWQFPTGAPMVSTPWLVEAVVYVGSSDNNLYALDATTGTQLWLNHTQGALNSPRVAGSIVYVDSQDRYLYAVDTTTGTRRWRFLTGGPVLGSPTVANGLVYVGSNDGYLYALNT